MYTRRNNPTPVHRHHARLGPLLLCSTRVGTPKQRAPSEPANRVYPATATVTDRHSKGESAHHCRRVLLVEAAMNLTKFTEAVVQGHPPRKRQSDGVGNVDVFTFEQRGSLLFKNVDMMLEVERACRIRRLLPRL